MAMSNTPDMTICPDLAASRDEAPFYSLNYQFGMLLGADDFSTEQQYHGGKMRLHNAWLHRAGVVWGFDVRVEPEHGEVRVTSGLALDGAGHELHLEGDACVNVAEWYAKHKTDPGFVETSPGVFDAHVEIRFKACLTRQIPALIEPCEGATSGVAYSRVFETVEIRLLPGKSQSPGPPPYHRLRVLFGLEPPILPADQPVVDAKAAAQTPSELLASFRKFAALDEIELIAADGLVFPAPTGVPVVLADITGLTLAGTPVKLTAGTADVAVRPSLIATAAIQEMLCGPALRGVSGSGPRVLPASVKATATDIDFELDHDLDPHTAGKDGFSVTILGATGWESRDFTPTVTTGPPKVNLHLTAALSAGTLVRVIAFGSGPKPLLGTDSIPLGDGTDFAFQTRS
jgi:hypothetical protein